MKSPLPATISQARTLADSTTRITVDFQEMPAEYMTELFQLKGRLGYFFFAEQPIREIDASKLPEIQLERGEKSKGQRLRGNLYILWEQTRTTNTFEEFYNIQMEKIINSVKEQLN